MSGHPIGETARRSGLSPDTLRYYERIGLLPHVTRSTGGQRAYTQTDLARLRFIRRAQQMNFSLKEIRQLLDLRERPASARSAVRRLTAEKLVQVEERLQSLQLLRNELALLVNLCSGTRGACPILQSMNTGARSRGS